MKTQFLSAIVFIASLISFASCGNDENFKDQSIDPSDEQILFGKDKNEIGNGDQEFTIKSNHTIKKGVYLLKGWVSIADGATLTIEPGTIIKGDKETKAALIAQRGGKLIAAGTSEMPIIFTSEMSVGNRKPGDWGGIILCGKAKTNVTKSTIEGGPDAQYGGDDDNDNSGVLSYVRCEFAGFPFRADEEINGVTLAGVGKSTKIDHVQVSYCNDDSFEFFGGAVNAKHLVAYHGWDDDFDSDNGYAGKLQFLLAVKNPKIADASLSNSFESDNNSDGVNNDRFTSCVFSNVTIIGPIGQASDFANTTAYINGGSVNPNNGSKTGIFQSAVQVRRSSRLSLFNSVATGFPVGLLLDNQKGNTHQWATEGNLKIKSNFFAGMDVLGSDINKPKDGYQDMYSNDGKTITDPTKPSFSSTFFSMKDNNNMSYENIADLKLDMKQMGLPMPGSPLLGKADFSDPLLASDFTKVTYVGAFASNEDKDNWTKGWTNFDPQNAQY